MLNDIIISRVIIINMFQDIWFGWGNKRGLLGVGRGMREGWSFRLSNMNLHLMRIRMQF